MLDCYRAKAAQPVVDQSLLELVSVLYLKLALVLETLIFPEEQGERGRHLAAFLHQPLQDWSPTGSKKRLLNRTPGGRERLVLN